MPRWWRIALAFTLVLAAGIAVLVGNPEPSDDPSRPDPAAVEQQSTAEFTDAGVDESDELAAEAEPASPPNGPQWRLDDRAALGALTVAPEDDGGIAYDRDHYDHYLGRDEDGCNLRDHILMRDAEPGYTVDGQCNVTGVWISWFDGLRVDNEDELHIDHLVAFAEAHRPGAWQWNEQRRSDFSNDPETLSAVSVGANTEKLAYDPASWRPPAEASWCRYAREWIAIKRKWRLSADRAEVAALAELLDTCESSPP